MQVSVTTTTSTCDKATEPPAPRATVHPELLPAFSAGGANGSNVSGLASGSYSVTATGPGCTAVASIDISDAGHQALR
ncbi:MAG: hypothetical protein IPN94_25570 [Sphingobacteriales bacterium]|nr:hypothetical protein [Sphingobacteriales bacterium]